MQRFNSTEAWCSWHWLFSISNDTLGNEITREQLEGVRQSVFSITISSSYPLFRHHAGNKYPVTVCPWWRCACKLAELPGRSMRSRRGDFFSVLLSRGTLQQQQECRGADTLNRTYRTHRTAWCVTVTVGHADWMFLLSSDLLSLSNLVFQSWPWTCQACHVDSTSTPTQALDPPTCTDFAPEDAHDDGHGHGHYTYKACLYMSLLQTIKN